MGLILLHVQGIEIDKGVWEACKGLGQSLWIVQQEADNKFMEPEASENNMNQLFLDFLDHIITVFMTFSTHEMADTRVYSHWKLSRKNGGHHW